MKKNNMFFVVFFVMVLISMVGFVACGETDEDDDDDDATEDDDDDTTDDDDDTTDDDDDSAGAGEPGMPCTSKDECSSDFCLDSAILYNMVGEEVDVTNGYCSDIGCTPGEADSEGCPASENGICFDLVPFGLENTGLCLRRCEADADCAREDGYTCVSAADLDGMDDQTLADYYTLDGVVLKACLNQGIVELAEDALTEE